MGGRREKEKGGKGQEERRVSTSSSHSRHEEVSVGRKQVLHCPRKSTYQQKQHRRPADKKAKQHKAHLANKYISKHISEKHA